VKPLTQSFSERVHVSSGCWEWTGVRSGSGYGRIQTRGRSKGAFVRAHRLSWEMHCGPIPDGFMVLHSCDNRGCVNPDHLFLGTQSDNMRDMSAKGRASRYRAHATHCHRGHEFTPENTLMRADGKWRSCRACVTETRKALKLKRNPGGITLLLPSMRTHCPKGHAYDETNTYRSPKGHRFCRQCCRDKKRAEYARSCS